ncbi:MAG TPA: nuclear transport factor 2 family protein [Candidatus Limnocylindrales bacterium]|nr:nuclear transport factor 2 family protein [Candidatus Limnocylindrales bacterium]
MPDERNLGGAAERAVVERYFAAVNARDMVAIVADLADDAEWSWPGSGEVIRGATAITAVVSGTPSLPHVLVHRIIGGPDLVAAVWTGDYGDGVPWRNISLFEFRSGRIVGKTDGFGSAFEPPAWRRALVSVEPLPKP